MKAHVVILLASMVVAVATAREYHVAMAGSDEADGSDATPLRTIGAAAHLAQPGDVITVHQGLYRERVNPPRGGTSDGQRIVYRAAPGERVLLKGSEVVSNWKKVTNDTWRVVIPNRLFGTFNPYADRIGGDWFTTTDVEHHTGAVYLKGHWMVEGLTLEQVLAPAGDTPLWLSGSLLNLTWWRPDDGPHSSGRIAACGFREHSGVKRFKAEVGEGSVKNVEFVGNIDNGDWILFEDIDFGEKSEEIRIATATKTRGGLVEFREDGPDGRLLGTQHISHTGGWLKWYQASTKIEPLSGVRTLCMVFKRPPSIPADCRLWFARVDEKNTTIWAQFTDFDPNSRGVEINVRQSVFYPDKPGIDFITVRGFIMVQAASPWAPPTAEQIGLIGTHWSKGWIIEDNQIGYSTCAGITLGKYGDEYDNASRSTADGYLKTIARARGKGWSQEKVGGHIVRNNRISRCEQAGIVGSLGAVFSTITGNVIHDIHVRGRFSGAEMAGIKLHGAIDTTISHNRILGCVQGIWLDWMTQGTRVTGNFLYKNAYRDLFMEANHGPFLVDNNLFLSRIALTDLSQGGAYVHNLFGGSLAANSVLDRRTPYHQPHSTKLAGMTNVHGGGNLFLNNIFIGHNGLRHYDKFAQPARMAGNVFLNGAQPSTNETTSIVLPEVDVGFNITAENSIIRLHFNFDESWTVKDPRQLVTTELLGTVSILDLPFVQPDESAYRLDKDYLGRQRNIDNPFPGPFRLAEGGTQALQIWPVVRHRTTDASSPEAAGNAAGLRRAGLPSGETVPEGEQ